LSTIFSEKAVSKLEAAIAAKIKAVPHLAEILPALSPPDHKSTSNAVGLIEAECTENATNLRSPQSEIFLQVRLESVDQFESFRKNSFLRAQKICKTKRERTDSENKLN
jgi:hypothetical protein